FISSLTHIDVRRPRFGSGSWQLSLSRASNPVLRHDPEGFLKIYREQPRSEAGAPGSDAGALAACARPGAGTMGCVTPSAAEYALADLAVRLGAAQVAGWSRAEQDLAAAAGMESGGGAGRSGWDDCAFRDFWDGRAGRDYGGPGDAMARLQARSL